MDNDELERVMNFIIQRQEQGAEQLAQAETIINALAKSQLHADKQLEKHDERIARFERSYASIADLLNRHDTQLVALTDGLNKLTQTVERYITARGNGDGDRH
jgi:archaellum component FlaC